MTFRSSFSCALCVSLRALILRFGLCEEPRPLVIAEPELVVHTLEPEESQGFSGDFRGSRLQGSRLQVFCTMLL